jgi:hypothetical protein
VGAADGGQKELSGLGTHLILGGGLDIGSHSNSIAERQGNIVFAYQTLSARDTRAWKTTMFLMKDIIRPKEPPLYDEKLLRYGEHPTRSLE